MNDYRINAKAIKELASGKWLEILPLLDARLADAVARAGKHVPCPNKHNKKLCKIASESAKRG